jgi:putative transposase
MPRYRLAPTRAQEAVLRGHCAHARYVWNLAVEQHSWWRPGRGRTPGYLKQAHQLTQARRDNPWLAAGSQTVQQQALRDFDQARRNFFAGTHRRPSWRKAGRDEGFRGVAVKPRHIRRLSRNTGELLVPKAGWVRFRWPRPLPGGVRSHRVTLDTRLAIARLRAREADIRRDWAEKASTDLARRYDLIRVEDLKIRNMTRSARGTREQPGRNVRQKAGLNREIMRSGWGLLVQRLDDKAPGQVERISPAFTSQRCSACGHVDAKSRKSQAGFACTACGLTCNADVNAARNIAAGHAVTARGGLPAGGPANREPQLLPPSA